MSVALWTGHEGRGYIYCPGCGAEALGVGGTLLDHRVGSLAIFQGRVYRPGVACPFTGWTPAQVITYGANGTMPTSPPA